MSEIRQAFEKRYARLNLNKNASDDSYQVWETQCLWAAFDSGWKEAKLAQRKPEPCSRCGADWNPHMCLSGVVLPDRD